MVAAAVLIFTRGRDQLSHFTVFIPPAYIKILMQQVGNDVDRDQKHKSQWIWC